MLVLGAGHVRQGGAGRLEKKHIWGLSFEARSDKDVLAAVALGIALPLFGSTRMMPGARHVSNKRRGRM